MNIEKIMEGASGAYAGLYGDEESAAAYDLISDALRYLENVSAYDSTLSAYQETLSSVLADLEDVTHGLKSYLDRIEFEDGALDRVEERLGLIAGLKRKYGKDIPAILAYYDRCTEELNRLSDSEETLVKLHAELDVLNKELAKRAAELTSAREKGGGRAAKAGFERACRSGYAEDAVCSGGYGKGDVCWCNAVWAGWLRQCCLFNLRQPW